jgi:hypothetical protein
MIIVASEFLMPIPADIDIARAATLRFAATGLEVVGEPIGAGSEREPHPVERHPVMAGFRRHAIAGASDRHSGGQQRRVVRRGEPTIR